MRYELSLTKEISRTLLGREEVGGALSEHLPVLVRGLPHDDCVDVDGRDHHQAEWGQLDSSPDQTLPLEMTSLQVDIVTLKYKVCTFVTFSVFIIFLKSSTYGVRKCFPVKIR